MNLIKKEIKKLKFILPLSLILILSIYMGFTSFKQNKIEARETVIPVKQCIHKSHITLSYITEPNCITKSNINDKACIDWILRHSVRISRRTATNIFKEAMSTNNGFLLLALARRESSFNPCAISKKGAIGLTQIRPSIWVKELIKNKIIKNKRDLFDYKTNLAASNYILTKYYKETGSWEKALKKYVGANFRTYVRDIFANCGSLYLLSKSKISQQNRVVHI